MSNRGSGFKAGSGNNSRPSSKDGPKKNIWSSMLDGVANGKRLPEKNLLILGASRYQLMFCNVPLQCFRITPEYCVPLLIPIVRRHT